MRKNPVSDPILKNVNPLEAFQIIQANIDNPDFVILDVRTLEEYEVGYIKGAKLLDFYDADFSEKLRQYEYSKIYLIYCSRGVRSAITLQMMEEEGFQEVYNLLGGINAWQQEGLPIIVD